jgi:hypothetical protein
MRDGLVSGIETRVSAATAGSTVAEDQRVIPDPRYAIAIADGHSQTTRWSCSIRKIPSRRWRMPRPLAHERNVGPVSDDQRRVVRARQMRPGDTNTRRRIRIAQGWSVATAAVRLERRSCRPGSQCRPRRHPQSVFGVEGAGRSDRNVTSAPSYRPGDVRTRLNGSRLAAHRLLPALVDARTMAEMTSPAAGTWSHRRRFAGDRIGRAADGKQGRQGAAARGSSV